MKVLMRSSAWIWYLNVAKISKMSFSAWVIDSVKPQKKSTNVVGPIRAFKVVL